MRKTRTAVGIGAALLAATILVTGIAWAKDKKTDLEGTALITPLGAVPEPTSDPVHVRRAPVLVAYSGDIVGDLISIASFNLDGWPGSGVEFGGGAGVLTLEHPDYFGWTGEYRMRLHAKIDWDPETFTWVDNGQAIFHFTGGDLEGMKLTVNFSVNLLSGPPMEMTYTAVLLDPHGG